MPRIVCKKCGYGERIWKLSDGRYRCGRCRFSFRTHPDAFRTNRPFISRLIEFFCLGVPAYRLRFRVRLSQPTILKLYGFFRELIYKAEMANTDTLVFDGVIEADEALFGGRAHGKRGWGAGGKVCVFGIYKRNGKVRVFPVSNRKAETLLPLIESHTAVGSLYYTDDYHAYASLAVRGGHVVAQKEKGIPKGRDHVNGIEGFLSYAKHWLYQYRGVPKHRFHLYLKEIEWRYNHRDEDLVPVLTAMVERYF